METAIEQAAVSMGKHKGQSRTIPLEKQQYLKTELSKSAVIIPSS
jgi:hypothetical protein